MTKLNKDIQAVQNCLKLSLELEQLIPSAAAAAKLYELKKALHALANSESPNVRKLSEIATHLHENMSAQHLSNFTVPLERFLDRSLRDDDFLVSTLDKNPDKIEIPKRRKIIFILDNIRSAFNVGSILRLADCVGASEILLCGYTPGIESKDPSIKDQENKINPTVMKTSLNAAQFVEIKNFTKVKKAIEYAKSLGYKIIALETAKNSQTIYEAPLSGSTAILVGNERFGLDTKILELADEVRHIPVFGVKNSLNVSNALTAAAFEWSRQNP